MSDKFQDLGITADYEQFKSEMLEILKQPAMFDAVPEHLLKEKELVLNEKETSTGCEFSVKVVLDGEKVHKVKDDHPAELDWVMKDIDYEYNEEQRCVMSTIYGQYDNSKPEGRQLQLKTFCFFLEPLQIMFYWELPNGDRLAHQDAANALQPYVEAICARIKDRKIKLTLDKEKKSVVSGPMEEHISYDALVNGLFAYYKKTNLEVVEATIVEEGEEKVVKNLTSKDGGHEVGTQVLTKDSSDGTLVMDFKGTKPETEAMSRTLHIKVNKDPLTLENWVIMKGERMTNYQHLLAVQAAVDEVVTPATSGWFF